MNRKLLYLGLVAVLLTWGGRELYLRSLGSPITPRPVEPAKPPLEAWHRASKLPWVFDPATAAYGDPRVGQALQLIDRELRQLASANWTASPPARYPFIATHDKLGPYYQRTYQATWHSSGKPKAQAANPTLFQQISVSFQLQESQPALRSFEVHGRLEKQDGLQVEWRFLVRSLGIEGSLLRVKHPAWLAETQNLDGREGVSLLPGGLAYHYRGSARMAMPPSLVLRNEVSNSAFRDVHSTFTRYWRSPEEFQATWLAEVDAFDLALQQWQSAGCQLTQWYGGTSGGDPAYAGPGKPATLATRLRIVLEASLLNNARRPLVQELSPAIYEALQESFPVMPELLKVFQSPPQT